MTTAFEVQRNPRQQRAYRQLQKLLAESRNGDLGWYYAVGEAFAALHPSGSGYREHWVRTTRSDVNCSRELAYRCLRLKKYYLRPEIEKLQRRGLRWNLVVCLMTVKDEKLRHRLQERAIAKDWSYRRLKVEVLRQTGCRPPRGGRKPRPEDHGFHVNLRRLVQLTEQWLAYDHHVWSVDGQTLACQGDALRGEQKTPDLVVDLRRVKKHLQILRSAAGKLREALDGLTNRLAQHLQRHEGHAQKAAKA